MLDQNRPMGHFKGASGMTNAEKAPKGRNAHMGRDHLKSSHLERAAMLHETQRGKMGEYGVLVEANPAMENINLEAAYRAHHEGHEFGTVLRAMSTPNELKALHEARAWNASKQEIFEPREMENEII